MADPKSFQLSSEIHDYLIAHGSPPDDIERRLIEETAALGAIARMQIAPEQGALLRILTRVIGATRAVEVGTFTGYSALCIARGLRPEGRLLCCDVSDEWTKIGRRHWEAAGVADRIELRLGPALDTLKSLPPGEVFDLAFIDADKTGYPGYYEEILLRTRPGGLILIDNVLQGGRVIDESQTDESVVAIRDLNDAIVKDERVRVVLLPIGDGVSVVQKI